MKRTVQGKLSEDCKWSAHFVESSIWDEIVVCEGFQGRAGDTGTHMKSWGAVDTTHQTVVESTLANHEK